MHTVFLRLDVVDAKVTDIGLINAHRAVLFEVGKVFRFAESEIFGVT